MASSLFDSWFDQFVTASDKDVLIDLTTSLLILVRSSTFIMSD